MEFTTLDLNIESAKELEDVNHFSKMKVYGQVSLSGDSYMKQNFETPVDRNGGANPTWNCRMKFRVDVSLARLNLLTLEIKFRTERTLGGDRDVGEVHIPVKELLDQSGDGKSLQFVSYQVWKPCGKPKGSLNLSYKVGEKGAQPSTAAPLPTALNKDEPVMAYTAPGAGSSQGQYAPQPQHAAVYQPPPYGAYAPPPQPGYVQEPPKTNKFGMGLKDGLIGQAVALGAAAVQGVGHAFGQAAAGSLIDDKAADASCAGGFDGGVDGGDDF